MTKILLFGKDGQVGWELQRSLACMGTLVAFGRADADLLRLETLRRIVRSEKPNYIVNAAAYTAVDKAETESDIATMVNNNAVQVLAEEAQKMDAWLIHYSTDYVFDGKSPTPYTEDDLPNPINVYGRTKLGGELAIRASGARHLVFRTSWVYASRGNNFVKTILRLARERESIQVVVDQVGAPASAELIADVTAQCMNLIMHCPGRFANVQGTYHLTTWGETSWCAYAKYIVDTVTQLGGVLRLKSGSIQPIGASDYPLPASRPANSRLSGAKLQSVFGIQLPHWRTPLERVLEQLLLAGTV